MSELNENTKSESPGRSRGNNPMAKAGIIIAGVIGAILLLIVCALCAATWYLTPERLTKIINTEINKQLNAKVTASNTSFTLWSSFPDLCINIDSLKITSYSLNGISPATRKQLPQNADLLATTGKVQGSVNIIKLLKKQIWIKELKIDSLNLNLIIVSDSVSNFNILKNTEKLTKIPYFTAEKISIVNNAGINIYDHRKQTDVDMHLSNTSLLRSGSSNNSYILSGKGRINAYQNGPVISELPFNISGATNLDFDPFRMNLANLSISLGNISGTIDAEIQANDKPELKSMSYKIDNFNPSILLQYFPKIQIKIPEGIKHGIIVNASAKLKTPYDISSKRLPSMIINCNMLDGEISYAASNKHIYTLRHSDIKSLVVLNGSHPDSSYVNIYPFTLKGEGTDLQINAHVSNLFNDPGIRLAMKGTADTGLANRLVKPLRHYNLKGLIECDALLDFNVSDISKEILENIVINGDVALQDYNLKLPSTGLCVAGDKLHINFGGKSDEITDKNIGNGIFDVKINAPEIHFNANGYDINVSNLGMSGVMTENHRIRLSDIPSSLPYDVNLKASSINMANERDSIRLSVKDFAIKGKVNTRPGQAYAHKFAIETTCGSVKATTGRTRISMKDITSRFSASEMKKNIIPLKYAIPQEWTADRHSLNFIDHSPEYLKLNLNKKIFDIIRKWEAGVSIKAESGTILNPALPLRNGFANLDIEASFDSIKLNGINFNSQDTRLKATGKVSNLRQFLTSESIAPLHLALNVDMDTIRINQLCGAYNHGLKLTHGPAASILTVIPDTLTSSDTISLMIPRNIIADIKASAMMTQYTNLYLHNLSTAVSLRNGILKVKDLDVSSNFGALKFNFEYDTSDIQRLAMKMQMNLDNVNLVNFFSNFHTLLLMMPQMRNLKGNISTGVDAKMLLFPNMYINMPSIWADMNVKGNNMMLRQDPFIRRITKMMLIPDSEYIRLADMDIHASVHDNLVEVYPFDISFDRYRMKFGGLNNFDGDMYYHLGVNKSPIPFPFGINIIGKFKHPEIKFGGVTLKIRKGEEITSSVMDNKHINLMLRLKLLIREMIEKAAEADTTPESFYTY